MSKPVLTQKHFIDEKAAYRFVEAHIWPDGRICPHCGVVEDSGPLKGNTTRIGLYKCYSCRKPFTVKMGTVLECSHIPLHLWLQAFFLLSSSKKGISSSQLSRVLGCTVRTAWFLSHRIREAMRDGFLAPMGGAGKVVEADEAYFSKPASERTNELSRGGKMISKHGRGVANKRVVIALVERGGPVRAFHVKNADKITVASIVTKNIARESHLHTDESNLYKGAEAHVAEHHSVNHAKGEYSRDGINNNSAEGFFSILKGGLRVVYQSVSEKHLHRYVGEYSFRFSNREALGSNDEARAVKALQGAIGKRLTYETTRSAQAH